MASNKADTIDTKHWPLFSRSKASHLVPETLVYTQKRTLRINHPTSSFFSGLMTSFSAAETTTESHKPNLWCNENSTWIIEEN